MSTHTSDVYALVLAGGAGTRFWPASRSLRPKQLLPLTGTSALLRQTVERVLPLCAGQGDPLKNVYIATGVHLKKATTEVLPELGDHQFLLEPVPRNTAPCIAWGAWVIAQKDPNAVVMVLPSDQHIENVEAFRQTILAAIESARGGTITTIGIKPTRAETGFGYIQVVDTALYGVAQPALRFVEKPDALRAQEYVSGGKHLWNAGMFFFRAGDMLRAVEKHQPKIMEGLRVLEQAAGRGEEEQALATVFPAMPSISIDHGVMDHLTDLAVVPGDFGWSDVGSFQATWELATKDAGGNAAPDTSVLIDAERCYALDLRTAPADGRKRTIALVGVHDLVVVETDDATLVVPRDRAQDVKLIVDELKRRGRTDLV
ncbi:MAG: mannose-1-phosphate guanylyltransferase [Polyangiaceae bacterium]|nr:mannose-1-phosphate guanylyltransferase [Polyangiaceae bacterium]